MTIQTARFNHGQLEEAGGYCCSRTGRNQPLAFAEAAVKHLQLTSGTDPDSLDEQVPYNKLAIGLYMDDRGLQMKAAVLLSRRGIVMTDRRLSLLAAPAVQPQPVAALHFKPWRRRALCKCPSPVKPIGWSHIYHCHPASAPQAREAALPSANLRLRKQ